MAAGFETAVDTRGDSTILQDSIGGMISKVLAAKVMADKERAYAKKQAWKQGIDEAQFDAMNPPGFFFKKALVGEFGGFAIKKKKQELAALYRKGLLLGKIAKNKRLRGKIAGQLKQSLIYSKANLKNAKTFRSQFDYTDYEEYFRPKDEKVPSTRKKVQNALGGGSGKRVSREQIIESIDAIAKSIERTAQSITQSSASVYGTLITANQLQADVAQDLKVRNSTLEDKLQKLVDVISNQTQSQKEFIDKKEDAQQEAQLERKTVAAGAETPDDLRTAVNESRTYSTFANEQAMMDPYLRQPPEVRPVNSMVNDTASMEAYGYPKAERGGMFGKGGVELHGTEALATDSGVQIVSGPDSGYLHKIDEPTSVIPLNNNYTQGKPSAVDGKTRPEPKNPMINNIQKFEMGTKNKYDTSNTTVRKFEMGTRNSFAPAALNINTDASQPLVDAMSLPMMAAGGGILAATSNYINSMGAAGEDIKPQLNNVTRSVADVFGLPSTIATKASGTRTTAKPKEEVETTEEDKDEKKSLFEKMKEGFGKFMELLGKKINESGNGGGGGGGGGTNADTGNLGSFIGAVESGNSYTKLVGGAEDASILDKTVSQLNQEKGGQFAMGKYQIQMRTASEVLSKAGIDPSTFKFDQAGQDKIYELLLKRRGLDDYLSGEITEEEFAHNLSKEWAALPKDADGASFYSGDGKNKAHRGWEETLTAIRTLKEQRTAKEPMPTTPVAGNNPNPPGALAAGQRPDKALSPEQHRVAVAARAEADGMGLTGKEKEKFVAEKVMAVPSPIFNRPSQEPQAATLGEISTNPRQNIKPQIVALNTGGSNPSTAGAATPPSLEDSAIPSGRNPLKDSGLYIG